MVISYIIESYGARETEMMNLGYQDPNWASANNSLRELYDSQETVTLRLAKSFEKIQRPAQPGGISLVIYNFIFLSSLLNLKRAYIRCTLQLIAPLEIYIERCGLRMCCSVRVGTIRRTRRAND